jgi:hypothetical protein
MKTGLTMIVLNKKLEDLQEQVEELATTLGEFVKTLQETPGVPVAEVSQRTPENLVALLTLTQKVENLEKDLASHVDLYNGHIRGLHMG